MAEDEIVFLPGRPCGEMFGFLALAVGGEGFAGALGKLEPAACDEFRSPARSVLLGHRREGDSRWGQRKS